MWTPPKSPVKLRGRYLFSQGKAFVCGHYSFERRLKFRSGKGGLRGSGCQQGKKGRRCEIERPRSSLLALLSGRDVTRSMRGRGRGGDVRCGGKPSQEAQDTLRQTDTTKSPCLILKELPSLTEREEHRGLKRGSPKEPLIKTKRQTKVNE